MNLTPSKVHCLSLILLSSLLGAPRTEAQTNPAAAATITGESADDDFGWRVVPAGDVNGDGVVDLIAGAPSNDAVAGFAGRAYLFHGPITGNLNAAGANARISAEAFGDNLGFSVAAAGDALRRHRQHWHVGLGEELLREIWAHQAVHPVLRPRY